MLMTFDTAPRGECILVSYDVSGGARSVAARVCQSVLVMSSHDAEELATRLRPLGVRVAMAPVTIPRTSLDAFRRPRA